MSYLVDMHCHLDLYPDFESVVNECEQKQVYTLAVTTIPAAWPKNKALTQDKKFIRPALGLHPQLATDKNAQLDTWDKYFKEAKYIGEVGLDASPRFYPSFTKQQENFSHILNRCAKDGSKVLSIHSVRTAKITLDQIVHSGAYKNNKIIFHWFTGTAKEARKAVELGCYFSVNIGMFNNPRSLNILDAIPKSRLLTETDGPFLSEGGAPIQPGSVESCIKFLASHFRLSTEQMKDIVYNNFSSLLRS